MSAFWMVFASVRYAVRWMTDLLVFHSVFKKYGKIPSENTWLAKYADRGLIAH